jgi:hypothetical protein
MFKASRPQEEASDLHGFRRYFATSMMQSGVSVETVRQWAAGNHWKQ